MGHTKTPHRGLSVVVVAGAGLLGFAGSADAAVLAVLTDENDLFLVDSARPEDILSGGAITGLNGQDLIGIDVRPANNVLYGVGNFGGLFTIDPNTRVATQVAAAAPVALQGTRFGVDFNPVPDRLRIVSDTDQNLRVNVDTGATIVDGPLQFGAGQPGVTGVNPNVTAAAYTNSFGPSPRNGAGQPTGAGTTLYGIDVRGVEDRVVIQNPPNDGTLTVVGPLGFDASALTGFDIGFENGANLGFAALQQTGGGVSRLYSINLATGGATLLGDLGGGALVDGIAVIPEPASAALLLLAPLPLLARRRRR